RTRHSSEFGKRSSSQDRNAKSYTHSSRFVTTPNENSLKIAFSCDGFLAAFAVLLATGNNESKSLSVRFSQLRLASGRISARSIWSKRTFDSHARFSSAVSNS